MKARNFVNTEAVKKVFGTLQLDALLAVYPKNVFYYTGSPISRSNLLLDYLPEDPGRATTQFAIILPTGSHALVCPEEDLAVNQTECWVPNFSTYSAYKESPIAGAVRALKEAGIKSGRVGIETTYLTVRYRSELEKLAPGISWVPCDEQFEWIRALKTPPEIALLKESADILDEAMLEAFSSAKAGDTEWEIHSRILEGCEKRGVEHCRGILHAGDNAEIAFSGSSNKKLAAGEIVRTDYAGFLHGYPSNLSRVAVVGEPTGLQRKIYANLISGHRRIMEFMRPGVTGREVFEFQIKAYADLGYLTTYRTILGHSLGLGYHERPILNACETMKLEAGMVFALEPKDLIAYHIQDQVVVDEYDTYLQSDLFDTRELFVIKA